MLGLHSQTKQGLRKLDDEVNPHVEESQFGLQSTQTETTELQVKTVHL